MFACQDHVGDILASTIFVCTCSLHLRSGLMAVLVVLMEPFFHNKLKVFGVKNACFSAQPQRFYWPPHKRPLVIKLNSHYNAPWNKGSHMTGLFFFGNVFCYPNPNRLNFNTFSSLSVSIYCLFLICITCQFKKVIVYINYKYISWILSS